MACVTVKLTLFRAGEFSAGLAIKESSFGILYAVKVCDAFITNIALRPKAEGSVGRVSVPSSFDEAAIFSNRFSRIGDLMLLVLEI